MDAAALSPVGLADGGKITPQLHGAFVYDMFQHGAITHDEYTNPVLLVESLGGDLGNLDAWIKAQSDPNKTYTIRQQPNAAGEAVNVLEANYKLPDHFNAAICVTVQDKAQGGPQVISHGYEDVSRNFGALIQCLVEMIAHGTNIPLKLAQRFLDGGTDDKFWMARNTFGYQEDLPVRNDYRETLYAQPNNLSNRIFFDTSNRSRLMLYSIPIVWETRETGIRYRIESKPDSLSFSVHDLSAYPENQFPLLMA